MIRFLKVVAVILIFALLTIVTQIGGIVLLISFLMNQFLVKRFESKWSKLTIRVSSFLLLYLLSVFVIVPMIARPLGRVPLPLFKTNNLQPGTILTFFLNRNYVRLELREMVFNVADVVGKEYPGTTLNYLDANFPFINKFPLLPHLSHNDGKKIDFAFLYINKKTGVVTNQIPSVIGYGICESPKQNEENMSRLCEQQGYWQYNFLQKVTPQGQKKNFEFDPTRTKKLIQLFAEQKSVARIFIEPHLKTRLGLTSAKVAFHGCHAVRHDDHFHVQLN